MKITGLPAHCGAALLVVTPFRTRPGQFVVPTVHHERGHRWYCHVVMPPNLTSLPTEERRELIEAACLESQLEVSIQVARARRGGPDV